MRTKLKTRFKRAAIGFLTTAIVATVTFVWAKRTWIAEAPPIPIDAAILKLEPEERDGRIWLGRSWVGERGGLAVAHLSGTPFEIGYARGVLLRDKIRALEDEFIAMVDHYVPNRWAVSVLHNYVLYRNRHLSAHVDLRYQMELLGAAVGCPDVHPELGPYFNRILNYHAAHDISYMLIDNPLVSKAGCTAFGAWGGTTANGHLITGRNFDWEASEIFSTDRIVFLYEPDEGIPFISLAWAGMAGVVSGMNREGLSVTINGAPSSLPGETATPMAIVARDVLQHAANLDEALRILKDSRVFVSAIWLIGSRSDGRFIAVEKTPDGTFVRETSGESVVCANHFQTTGLKDGEGNRNYESDGTSLPRQQRLEELITSSSRTIDPTTTAAILRDRNLPGGDFHGNGNRAALNALIATHATIMDLNDGIFWAAKPPHQLGEFVAFDVADFERQLPERTLPADPLVTDSGLDEARQAGTLLVEANEALEAGNAARALELADKAESLNPGFYRNAMLKGRALSALDRTKEAASSFREALDRHPAFRAERDEIESWLKETEASP